jgi:excisionase family DNA binding protein
MPVSEPIKLPRELAVRQLLSIPQLAAMTGFDRMTIHRMIKRKEIPSLKIGYSRRFRLDKILRWLDKYEDS